MRRPTTRLPAIPVLQVLFCVAWVQDPFASLDIGIFNIKKYWWDSMVLLNENVVWLDSAILMHPTVWEASGQVDTFNDPLIDNKDSKKRYRADVLIEEYLDKIHAKIDKEIEKAKKWAAGQLGDKIFSMAGRSMPASEIICASSRVVRP